MPPDHNELLDVLRELLIDAEKVAWDGFSMRGDDDLAWRRRVSEEFPDWAALIARARRAMKETGVNVPTPIEIRERDERHRAEERERKQRLDAKRCRTCGLAKGHKKTCPKRKVNRV